ncbi:protein TolR [Indioceanicola profundi]|uniref:protein TolR n=1 Tax=Indioceanicola profundi TaxID=2220096 RepID=UPI000E6AD5A8|nr:protein TolR [Indioceanicola profundi]
MGAQLAGKSGGGRGGKRRYRAMSEINVTPFVDVMLVLLIVFMVAAPLLTVGVPIDLPKTNAPAIQGQDEPLVISVDGEGTVYVNETATDMEQLVPLLTAITENNPEARIFVRGDRNLAYGRIVEVMGTVSAAGFKKVALVAEMPDQPAARR